VTLNRNRSDRLSDTRTQEAKVATRANLHGDPLKLAKEIQELYREKGDPTVSRRSCRKKLAKLVCDLATQTNVEPKNFAGFVPPSIVAAIARERTNAKLKACGVVAIASRSDRRKNATVTGGRRRGKRLATAA
jgi:hypothetical protein